MTDVTRSTKLRFYNGVGKDEALRIAANVARRQCDCGAAFNLTAALIIQSTSVTKPAMNGLPFAADGTEIEKVWPFFL
jgi:hypothetical protein